MASKVAPVCATSLASSARQSTAALHSAAWPIPIALAGVVLRAVLAGSVNHEATPAPASRIAAPYTAATQSDSINARYLRVSVNLTSPFCACPSSPAPCHWMAYAPSGRSPCTVAISALPITWVPTSLAFVAGP